jgi:hypothetical protein
MTDVPESLAALEERLSGLSHETEALDLIQAFAQSLGKTKALARFRAGALRFWG